MIFLIETDSQLEIRDLKTLTLEKINIDIYIYGLYFWFIILNIIFIIKKILTFIFSLYNFKLTRGDK